MAEQLIGVVDHWYGKINVAGVRLTDGQLNVGDTIHFLGHTTDFTETVQSMQIDHEAVTEAGPGDQVGIKVADRVRTGDSVYLVTN
ncbi:MAG: EF-Tu/IF-2/RF-3 family GTPase [Acidimicrobiia bacterium]